MCRLSCEKKTTVSSIAQGFTLIELCVFMTVISILATGVVYMYSNPTAKVKGVAFNILGDLSQFRNNLRRPPRLPGQRCTHLPHIARISTYPAIPITGSELNVHNVARMSCN